MRGRSILVMSLVAVLAVFAASTRAASPMLEGNPLAMLPSKPGPTIMKIKAMKKNTWLNLGSPAADPKWGRARGRSWGGSAMVPAPDLRGAMYTGEGRHAFVKPDGYGMDDWWFYDINAHAWICVWPGTNTKDFNRQVKDGEIKVDKKGRAVDASGQPVPGHILIHTYHWLTYNPDQKKFVLAYNWAAFGKYYMPGGKAVHKGIDALKAQGLGSARKVWSYDTKTGRFDHAVDKPAAPFKLSFGYFEYIPDRKQYVAIRTGGDLAYLDAATGKWSNTTKTPLRDYEYSGCYDTKRKRVYIGNAANNFYCIDLKNHAATPIEFPKSDTSLSSVKGRRRPLGPNGASVVYDSANDRVLVFRFGSSGKIYPIDPATNKVLDPIPPEPAYRTALKKKRPAAFYDADLGVCFIFMAGDSGDNGQMWVYKYGAAEAKRGALNGKH